MEPRQPAGAEVLDREALAFGVDPRERRARLRVVRQVRAEVLEYRPPRGTLSEILRELQRELPVDVVQTVEVLRL